MKKNPVKLYGFFILFHGSTQKELKWFIFVKASILPYFEFDLNIVYKYIGV